MANTQNKFVVITALIMILTYYGMIITLHYQKEKMKLQEIIEIRTSKNLQAQVEKLLKDLIKDIQGDSENNGVKLFQRMNLNVDFSIQLIIDSRDINGKGSMLGQRVASIMKEHGIVNHSFWIEIDEKLK